MCSVSKYWSWQTFDRNASLAIKVLLVSDLVSAVSGTQEQGSVVMSQTTSSQPCVPPLGELMSLTKVCRLLSVPSQMHKAECRMLEGTLLPSPSANVFQTHHPLPALCYEIPLDLLPISKWFEYVKACFLQSWRCLYSSSSLSQSVMVMNKNWSLYTLLLSSFLPGFILCFQSFNLHSIHKRAFPPVLLQPVCFWLPVTPLLMTLMCVQAHAERVTIRFHSSCRPIKGKEGGAVHAQTFHTEMSWAAGSQGICSWSSVPQLLLNTDSSPVISSQSCTILPFTN